MVSWDRARTPFQESNLKGQIGRTLRASNTSLISVCPAFTSVHADAKMENRLMEHIIRIRSCWRRQAAVHHCNDSWKLLGAGKGAVTEGRRKPSMALGAESSLIRIRDHSGSVWRKTQLGAENLLGNSCNDGLRERGGSSAPRLQQL